MERKIARLKELLNMDLMKEVDPMEWVDHYEYDDEKIAMWNSEIMEILKSINHNYTTTFYNVQKQVSIDFSLGDFKKSENLKASKKCLEEIIKELENK